jgi:hypothetical protein
LNRRLFGFKGYAKVAGIIFACTLCSFCEAVPHAELKGKVKHHVYYSPEKNFSVAVPQAPMGPMLVEDQYDNSGFGAVSFHDELAGYRSIQYMRIPPDLLAKVDDPPYREQLLSDWFHNFAVKSWFRAASPDPRILHEKPAKFENMDALLAQVELPGGSTISVLDKSGRPMRLDALRAVVIFRHRNYVYMLTVDITHNLSEQGMQKIQGSPKQQPTETRSDQDSAEDWINSSDRLKGFYSSITFAD